MKKVSLKNAKLLKHLSETGAWAFKKESKKALFSNKESDTGNTQAGAVCCNSNKALLLNV
jgi:hypothetical protein